MKFCTIETATAESIEVALDEAYLAVLDRRLKARRFLAEVSDLPVRVTSREKVPLARYQECAEQGLSIVEAARKLGISPSAVHECAKRYKFHFRDGRVDNGPKART